ncbi:MAG: DUF3299 domain-containing protein [Hyphomonadaceae bacterium]
MTNDAETRFPRIDLTKRRFCAGSVFALGAVATHASLAAAQSTSDRPTAITWDDLWPEGEDDRLEELYETYMAAISDAGGNAIEEGSAADSMIQFGTFNTVEKFNGKLVRIPGYVVPFDFNTKARHETFLLVPYFGACIHTPPPPPNQIINVTANPAVTIKDMWAPVWAEGVLSTKRTDSTLADAAYGMALTRIEPYAI